jgi:dsRNA-specific ribonuclease
MGHAAFERAQEDIDAYQEWLKEEEQVWAAMASSVDIKYKQVDWNGKPPKRRKGSRALGNNPRAKGTNPRTVQTNKLDSQVTI